jgi:hypothetical protein
MPWESEDQFDSFWGSRSIIFMDHFIDRSQGGRSGWTARIGESCYLGVVTLTAAGRIEAISLPCWFMRMRWPQFSMRQ